MKNKCLLVLLLALGCCHVQAQKSQKDPLSEALVRLNQKVDSELIPGIKRFPLIGISTDISPKRTAVNTAYVQSVILSGGIPYMIFTLSRNFSCIKAPIPTIRKSGFNSTI